MHKCQVCNNKVEAETGPCPFCGSDLETGQTPQSLLEMGWPMTGEPVEDTVEPKHE